MQVAFITALQATTTTKLTAGLATSSPLPIWDNEHPDNKSNPSLQWVQTKSCVPNYSVRCYNKTIIVNNKTKMARGCTLHLATVKGRSKTGQFLEGIWIRWSAKTCHKPSTVQEFLYAVWLKCCRIHKGDHILEAVRGALWVGENSLPIQALRSDTHTS